MRNLFGPGTTLGYCTNVHAGATYDETLANLERYAVRVKERVSPDEPMGVGLWLSARAARELLDRNGVSELRDWLAARGLLAFTFNGFPHGDFHQPVVKFDVYHPDWSDESRLLYTIDLTAILSDLLTAGAEGSISTVPVGWGSDFRKSPQKLDAAAANLRAIAERLARLEADQGRLIHVDLEPEPGCFLTTSADVVEFFERYLLAGADERVIRRHLRVCHDVCHAAVMFEDQAAVLERYRSAGIEVGKVQLSSAIRARFDSLDEHQRRACLRQVGSFAEDRYLHQTVMQPAGAASDSQEFVDDLPRALDLAGRDARLLGEWRVHFHVPLYLERFGLIETSQQQVLECLAALRGETRVRHFEVETYAWNVLPRELQVEDLAEGIAGELRWVREQVTATASA